MVLTPALPRGVGERYGLALRYLGADCVGCALGAADPVERAVAARSRNAVAVLGTMFAQLAARRRTGCPAQRVRRELAVDVVDQIARGLAYQPYAPELELVRPALSELLAMLEGALADGESDREAA